MWIKKQLETSIYHKLIRIAIVLLCFAVCYLGGSLFRKTDIVTYDEFLKSINEYCEFIPNGKISVEATDKYEAYTEEEINKSIAKVYTEHLKEWKEKDNVKVLRLEPFVFLLQSNLQVITYKNPVAYENSWEDFSYPLEEGRWFEGEEDEVICVNNSSYVIGDEIILKDANDQSFKVKVVGKMKNAYFYSNIFTLADGMSMPFRDCDDSTEVLLLNPQSKHNEKNDFINYGSTFIYAENEAVYKEIEEYGECHLLSKIMIKQSPTFFRNILELVISIVLLIVCIAIEIYTSKRKKQINCKIAVVRDVKLEGWK